jgi:alpha-amylase
MVAKEALQCWAGDNIVSLPDLRTEDANVLSMWERWITQLVANYTSTLS